MLKLSSTSSRVFSRSWVLHSLSQHYGSQLRLHAARKMDDYPANSHGILSVESNNAKRKCSMRLASYVGIDSHGDGKALVKTCGHINILTDHVGRNLHIRHLHCN